MTPSRLLVLLNVVWIALASVAWMRVETSSRRLESLERAHDELQAEVEALQARERERAGEDAAQWERIRAHRLLLEDRAGRDDVEDLLARIDALERRLQQLEK